MRNAVSIIIPTYNGKNLLKENLPGVVLECSGYAGETEILIIDDASTDDTLEFVASEFPQVRIIKKEKNEGFSKTANKGILQAKHSLVFLLNNDIEITSGILEKLTNCFEEKDVFAVQCKIISKIEDKDKDYLNKFYLKYGLFVYKYERVSLTAEVLEMDFVSGGASVFDRDKFISLGLFDENFSPFYFEDLDLCYRAKLFGWKMFYVSASQVYHLHLGSTVKSNFSAFRWNLIHKKNYFLFILRNLRFMKICPLCLVSIPAYVCFKALKGNFYFALGFVLSLPLVFKKRKLHRSFQKKNILFVDAPLVPAGGGQISLLNIVGNLKSFRPFVVFDKNTELMDYLNKKGLPFYAQDVSKINMVFVWGRIINLIKMINPACIHCNSGATFFTFVFALAAKILKIPFIWHIRVVESGGIKEKIIANLSSKIIVISDAVKEKFNGLNKEKVVKIYNAVDIDKFRPLDDVDYLYEELKLKKDVKIIGVFSRLDKWKGHKLFLGAAKIMIEKGSDCSFLIVGEGSERDNIEKYIRDLGIEKTVSVLGHRKDIVRLMNLCDIVVNPSIEPEPFGRTIIEAMACEKVVIATNMGGPKEIIENEVDGFLVEAKAEEIADTIFRALNNPAEAVKMGTNARKKVMGMFDIKLQIKKMQEIYQKAINKR
ncbi:MAG: glycosyltransferase [Elusimicrobia bacterium]|nr:glycosyltransferase [Elusimicrobiota bacterium]